jgi:hypothetical protein
MLPDSFFFSEISGENQLMPEFVHASSVGKYIRCNKVVLIKLGASPTKIHPP